jgi:hypothetical protein
MQAGLQVGLHRALDRQEPQAGRFLAIAQPTLAIAQPRDVERLQDGIVEPASALEVADADRDVVEYVFLLYNSLTGYMVKKGSALVNRSTGYHL